MNLQTDVHEVRRRIAEEFADDDNDASVTDEDIVGWLNEAEKRFVEDAPAEVALTDSGATGLGLLGQNTQNVASGSTTFALPSDFLKPISVEYTARGNAGSVRTCRLLKYDEYRLAKALDPSFYPSYDTPMACVFNGNVLILPVGQATISNGYILTYVRIPQRRFRRYSGTVTSVTSTTVFADSKMTAKGWPDDYFNTYENMFTSGTSRGQTSVVNDYTKSTGTITLASGASLITVGNSFEVGEQSAVPNKYRNIVMEYATYLALCKDRDEIAQKHMNEYQRMINSLQGRALGLEVPQA